MRCLRLDAARTDGRRQKTDLAQPGYGEPARWKPRQCARGQKVAARQRLVAGNADNQQCIGLAGAEIIERRAVLGPSLGRAEVDAEVDKLRIRTLTALLRRSPDQTEAW